MSSSSIFPSGEISPSPIQPVAASSCPTSVEALHQTGFTTEGTQPQSSSVCGETIDSVDLSIPTGNESAHSPALGLLAADAPALPAPLLDADSQVDDSAIFAKLAALTQIEYDRVRKEKAKAMGIQVKTLDGHVKTARSKLGQPDLLPFAEVEPHTDPIDPAALLDEVSATGLRHVVMTHEQADAFALWVAMTWFIDEVDVAPLFIITAPEKQCGKSQLLDLLAKLVSRPLSVASSSASFVFRSIQLWHPTLLIDEGDTFIRDQPELKGLINAGHTRANAFVGRTEAVGDSHAPKLFDVWCAKAFAGISLDKHLPDATMSRGIVLNLRRKLPHEEVSRLRHADKQSFGAIASKLARFANDYSQQVRTARPELPDELNDRAQDNWEPLFAIAACAGPDWIERATEAAITLSGESKQPTSIGSELLADIFQVFENRKETKISTVDLLTALTEDPECAWATYNRGRPLTPRQLSQKLKQYDIGPKTVRQPSGATPKGYDEQQFEDAFDRYLTDAQKVPQLRNTQAAATRLLVLGNPQHRHAATQVDDDEY